jgi:isoaspartyl peptidase/L-asparaginase-like protein (Ntn-hydrolase superfamily)
MERVASEKSITFFPSDGSSSYITHALAGVAYLGDVTRMSSAELYLIMSAHRAHHQPLYIIAVHGGAGYHQPASDTSLKRNLRVAISSAQPAFSGTTTRRGITTTGSSGGSSSGSSSSSSALDATTAVIAALEDHPDFNAGYGSNLTFDGQVECDASLMLSTTEERSLPSSSPSFSYSFGSVGAVRAVRNPVLLARCVLEERIRERERGSGMGMGMGRVPPLMLVGEGAVQFAREHGVRVVDASDSEEMVAPRAREEWRVWRERCSRWKDDEDGLESGGLLQGEEKELEDAELEPLRVRQDTVGAVVLVGDSETEVRDVEQNLKVEVAAGVSRCVMSSSFPPSLLLFLDARTRLTFFRRVSAGVYCSNTLDA